MTSSSIWLKKRIWIAPVILASILIFVQIMASVFGLVFYRNYFYLVMIVFVMVLVAFLTERIEKVRTLNQLNEELQMEREKLKAANQELETFAYSVSHDLKVPLRAIDGFSRILGEDYHEKLDDEGKRLIDIIRQNTKKMSQLIDDILHLSRAGRQDMMLTKIDLESLIQNAFNELKQSNKDRNIQLEIEPLPPVYGDRALLQQVISNLIANSFKFTGPRETALIEVGFQVGKKEYIFHIKDNGVGFNMKYSDKLFGLFQRLHGQDEFDGTGVGLSIVQRIIRRHGGDIWAEGKVDEGATFYFSLPVQNDIN
ncbi:MAG TPA: ATP-binding protein [Methanobacterium sp.]|jgi:two-component system sensor kinase|nr:MAG: two-component sensor histidine kinase [Methanobacterium sp.]HOI70815.1 ATP-binding protein [Methanobacterium sp.]HPX78418.1 ATP-binding protein [Methanobacterium sp.]